MENDDYNKFNDFFEKRYRVEYVPENFDPNYVLDEYYGVLTLNPHYTNPHYKQGKTHVVYGKKEEGLGWDYSDRLWEWDYDKAKKSSQIAREKFNPKTANFFQEYLCQYFGKKIVLVCIIAGVNISNGYPYLVFGYKEG